VAHYTVLEGRTGPKEKPREVQQNITKKLTEFGYPSNNEDTSKPGNTSTKKPRGNRDNLANLGRNQAKNS